MANPAMQLIKTITVGAGGSPTIDFTGIPQVGFTDLMLVVSARSSRALLTDNLFVKFNNLTTNLSGRILYGNGTAASSDSSTSVAYNAVGEGSSMTTNAFGNMTVYIPNYSGNTAKSMSTESVTETAGSESYQNITSSNWNSAAAINQITLYWGVGPDFVEGSTASLYGITSTAVAAKATGGWVMKSGNYVYHVFNASGTFSASQSLTADILVIAGGGGGAAYYGGGGGAGGVQYFAGQSISTTPLTVTVGAGGNPQMGGYGSGPSGNGGNSQFGALAASIGGGGGVATGGGTAGSGGSGGGGAYSSNSGSGTAGQGYGGGGMGYPAYGGGGGGGAAGAGGSGYYDGYYIYGGSGGTATSAYSSWAVATNTGVYGSYAGGGGGAGQGAGGWGGGGGAGSYSGPQQATANTGSGGGAGGAGGSGIVIVRYLA